MNSGSVGVEASLDSNGWGGALAARRCRRIVAAAPVPNPFQLLRAILAPSLLIARPPLLWGYCLNRHVPVV